MRKTSELIALQKMPLDEKIAFSQCKIEEFYYEAGQKVFVAYSGGRDSTVLLHLIRTNPFIPMKDIPAVFVNTGLEWPEIVDFVKNTENVTTLRPDKSFRKVIEEYGYPIISKKVAALVDAYRNSKSRNLRNTTIARIGNSPYYLQKNYYHLIAAPFKISAKCCTVMKKNPIKKYKKETGQSEYLGMLAAESEFRKADWLTNSCNIMTKGAMKSRPMMIWTLQDIVDYVKKFNLPICSIYDRVDRTGCLFCLFGCMFPKNLNNFAVMKELHPKLYNVCMDKIGLREVCDYLELAV
jgi:3'-phosphoadenosine 5'-phosphosulfate sulfotransferase (PAPS reductase)/FAD synthetase